MYFYIWVLKCFLRLLLSGQTHVPLQSLQLASQGYRTVSTGYTGERGDILHY